ncbi:hypothetical protein EEL32_01070 [Brevibacillus laterosporus]|nr:hypothetical protein [Brevibacillus laterosporus]TPG92987.1 hypothetical protein EEL32_01070 [Brevibacillus laterosporus]
MKKVVIILINSPTITSMLAYPVCTSTSSVHAATIITPLSPVLTNFQQLVSTRASGSDLKAFVDQHISTVSKEEAIQLVLGLEYYYVMNIKIWKTAYEQPLIQGKLKILGKKHTFFDKLIQQDPLIKNLQHQAMQEGYKLTWKGQTIQPLSAQLFERNAEKPYL